MALKYRGLVLATMLALAASGCEQDSGNANNHCAKARTGRCTGTGQPQTLFDGAQKDAQRGVENRWVARGI